MFRSIIAAIACLLVLSINADAQLVMDNIPELQGIDIEEHLGEFITPELWFTDSKGERKQIGDYFHKGKPVFLTLAYYECPMLCTLVLNAVANGAKQVNLIPGVDFQMLTVSIDPDESVKLASDKQYRYNRELGGKGSNDPWIFHVGEESQIKALADQLGFKYFYDEKRDEYAHPAAAFILTEEGKISRYLYGLDFKPKDLRFGLMEASRGNIGSTLDKIILYCFHYDPDAKGYVLFARNVMRLGGVLILIGISILLGSLWAKERIRNSREKTASNKV